MTEEDLQRQVRRVVASLHDLTREIAIEAPAGLIVKHGMPLRLKGRITNTSTPH